jgi:benzoylformate decarboxylase
MSGAKAMMEALKCEGTEYIFGLPGSTELLFLDALEDYPDMKYILGLHEVVSLGMAEGYARQSGKVGVVNLNTCAGLSAAAPALLNAYLGGVPGTGGQQRFRLSACPIYGSQRTKNRKAGRSERDIKGSSGFRPA